MNSSSGPATSLLRQQLPILWSQGCAVCSEHNHKLKFSKDGMSIHECHHCGAHFLHPLPSERTLAGIYDATYFERRNKYSYLGQTSDPNYLNDLRKGEFLFGNANNGEVLDVGCALGGFMESCWNRGLNPFGIDISASACRRVEALGLPIHCGTLSTAPDQWRNFDFIAAWDVIEHVRNPKHLLQNAFARLAPGGVLGLSTPDIGSRYAQALGNRWHLLTPPEHVFFFTKSAMHQLLTKVGFSNIHISHFGKIAHLEFLVSKSEETFGSVTKLLGHLLQWTKLHRKSLDINLRDIMYVKASKPLNSL